MFATDARVAVVGGGYMGGGIAQTFAAHGHPTAVVDATPARTRQLVASLREQITAYADRGLVDKAVAHRALENLRPAETVEDAVADAVYVTEAVPERVEVKDAVLRAVSAAVGAEAVIATNTSAITIGDLAKSVTKPVRFLGVHWMNPAPFVPCVEVIPAADTRETVVAEVEELLRRLGKVPTVVGDSPGFVANRLQYALLREAIRVLEEGLASPSAIDEVVRNSFGFRLPFFGPFAIADIAGLDVYLDGFRTMEAAYGERIGIPSVLGQMVRDGAYGLKSGRGFFALSGELTAAVQGYRDSAYAELSGLLDRIGRLSLPEASAAPGAG